MSSVSSLGERDLPSNRNRVSLRYRASIKQDMPMRLSGRQLDGNKSGTAEFGLCLFYGTKAFFVPPFFA